MTVIRLTGTDAIQVRTSGTSVLGREIVDEAPPELLYKAHRDGVQFIPERTAGVFNTQFAGAILHDVAVEDTSITSEGFLQCVFCSDGGVHAKIRNNTLQTNGKHFITLCMMSGTIENNRDAEGELVPVRLLKMRVGGNSDGTTNVVIATFKNPEYNYAPLSEIVKDDTLYHVTDYRFVKDERPNYLSLYNFDLDAYILETEKRQLTADEMRELALQYGDTEERRPMELSAKAARARGIRNHNPGNVETSTEYTWLGTAKESEMTEEQLGESRFCVFVAPEYGIRAIARTLQTYQSKHKLKSIKKMIERYAPRADKNNTSAYVAYVSAQTGIKATAVCSVLDYRTVYAIIAAIIQKENGVPNPYPDEIMAKGLAMAGVSMPEELVEEKSLGGSTEFTRGGAVVGGTGVVGGIEAYTRYTEVEHVPETTKVEIVENGAVKTIDVIEPSALQTAAESLSHFEIAQLVFLGIIAFAAVDWMLDRALTKKLGLR